MPRATMAEPVQRTRLGRWRHQHAWCLRDGVRQLGRHPLGTALAVLVMGLALALPLAFLLLLTNVRQLGGALGDTQSINVFLATAATGADAQQLAAHLQTRADVGAVSVRTPQQGLQELASVQGFGAAIHSLPDNPLPYVLLVTPRAGTGRVQARALAAALRAMPHVDRVQDNGRWRDRLAALLTLGRRAGWLLALALCAAAVLVVGNTVRLDLRSHADAIAVQRLLGADAAFVRRPYLYEGAWYGLAAGILAVLLVLALEAVLAAPVRDLVASYADRLQLGGLPWGTLALTPLVAAALGWFGARIATAEHLALRRG